jgi:hypothetical protein
MAIIIDIIDLPAQAGMQCSVVFQAWFSVGDIGLSHAPSHVANQ